MGALHQGPQGLRGEEALRPGDRRHLHPWPELRRRSRRQVHGHPEGRARRDPDDHRLANGVNDTILQPANKAVLQPAIEVVVDKSRPFRDPVGTTVDLVRAIKDTYDRAGGGGEGLMAVWAMPALGVQHSLEEFRVAMEKGDLRKLFQIVLSAGIDIAVASAITGLAEGVMTELQTARRARLAAKAAGVEAGEAAASARAELRKQMKIKNDKSEKAGEPKRYEDLDESVETAMEGKAAAEQRGFPYGFTDLRQFEAFKAQLKAGLSGQGLPPNTPAIQGSSVFNPAAKDVDIAVLVSKNDFERLLEKSFGTPNPGSSAESTMLHAKRVGKITAGRLKPRLSALRDALQGILGKKVDLSIILKGGEFDVGPFFPLGDG